MKKTKFIIVTLFACFFFLGGTLPAKAQGVGEQIVFRVGGVDDTPGEPGYGKGPILMPTVWQDGYFFDFQGTHADYVLHIVDASDTVVYSTVVLSYQTLVWLPTTLVGTYELQLYDGGAYYFYSEIEL
jgi:hypothetical protein